MSPQPQQLPIDMIVTRREQLVGDVRKLRDKLRFEEGLKELRYFKKGKSLITAMSMTEFRSHIDFDKPLLYISPIPSHDAPFVLQSDRIIVKAENKAKANELVDVFISNHKI